MAGETVRVVQLTDCHLVGDPAERLHGVDTHATLAAVIERVCAGPPLDAVLATGDLSQDGSAESYRRFGALCARLGAPVHCLPGNHDDGPVFGSVLSANGVRVDRAPLVGGWCVVMLDSTVAGEEDGRLDAAEVADLDRVLGEHRDRHALVCLHHHPVAVGGGWRDAVSLANPEDLFAVIDRHPQVRGVLWGHVHQPFDGIRMGVRLLGSPSTCFQFAPSSDGTLGVAADPPAYRRLELSENGEIDTEVCWLDSLGSPAA